ncbi:MAG: MarR family transcriptional regulator [candidate division Zixibacteria bacterium]|nr:MarR family transcriptional regulator [candidate division Zixibacteria bacterium]
MKKGQLDIFPGGKDNLLDNFSPRSKKWSRQYIALYFLAQGKAQSWLVKRKGFEKGFLSEIVKKLVKNGWLIPIKNTYPKLYRATPLAPLTSTGEKGQLVHFDSTEETGQLLTEGSVTRLHNTRWKMNVLSKINRKITWDKTTNLKHGVKNHYLYFPTITIQFTTPNSVTVFLLPKYIREIKTKERLKMVDADMQQARGWLQKVMQCRLSIPKKTVDEEYARPITNPVLMRVLEKEGMIRIGAVWIDASKPGFKFGELESQDPEKLNALQILEWSDQNIPLRMKTNEADIIRLEGIKADKVDIMRLENRMNGMETIIKKPDEYIDVQ